MTFSSTVTTLDYHYIITDFDTTLSYNLIWNENLHVAYLSTYNATKIIFVMSKLTQHLIEAFIYYKQSFSKIDYKINSLFLFQHFHVNSR